MSAFAKVSICVVEVGVYRIIMSAPSIEREFVVRVVKAGDIEIVQWDDDFEEYVRRQRMTPVLEAVSAVHSAQERVMI